VGQQFKGGEHDPILTEIEISVATPDEIPAANNFFARECV
jgi:hypothetical protein